MFRSTYLVSLFAYFVFASIPIYFPNALKLGFALLFLIYTLVLVSKKKRVDNGYFKWTIWFTVFCGLSVLWAINGKLTMYTIVMNMVPIYSVMLSLTAYIQSKKDFIDILRVFYIASVCFLIFVLSSIDIGNIEGNRLVHSDDDGNLEGMNSNYIAGRLAYSIYLGFPVYGAKNKGKIQKIPFLIYLAISGLMALVILLSGSRTSLLILVLPVLFIAYARNKKNRLKFILLTVCFIGGLCILVMKVPVLYSNIGMRMEDAVNVASGNAEGDEDVSRIILAQMGLQWFAERPVLGYGMNCFRELSNKTSWFAGKNFYAHNNFIETMVGVGVIGLIIYYFSYIRNIRSSSKANNQKQGSVVTALLLTLMITDMFWVSYYNVLSQFILCLTFVIVRLDKKKISVFYEDN